MPGIPAPSQLVLSLPYAFSGLTFTESDFRARTVVEYDALVDFASPMVFTLNWNNVLVSFIANTPPSVEGYQEGITLLTAFANGDFSKWYELAIYSNAVVAQYDANITMGLVVDGADAVLDARGDSLEVVIDQEKVIYPLSNDQRTGPVELDFNQPLNGTVTEPFPNRLVYTPDPGFEGQDSFTYTLRDIHGGVDTATVTLNVAPANIRPIGVGDVLNVTTQGEGVFLDVLANDTDPNGDTIGLNGLPGRTDLASLSFAPGGITYTPFVTTSGYDRFQYDIRDGRGEYTSAVVLMRVTYLDANGSPVSLPFDGLDVQALRYFTLDAPILRHLDSNLTLRTGPVPFDADGNWAVPNSYGIGVDAGVGGVDGFYETVLSDPIDALADLSGFASAGRNLPTWAAGVAIGQISQNAALRATFETRTADLTALLSADMTTAAFDLANELNGYAYRNLVFGTGIYDSLLNMGALLDQFSIAVDTSTQDVSYTIGADPRTLGDGSDIFVGSFGKDTVLLGEGNDIAFGGIGDDVLTGGAGNDRLWGGAGNDILIDASGSNSFYGGPGQDTVDLLSGFDGFEFKRVEGGLLASSATGTNFIAANVETVRFSVSGTYDFSTLYGLAEALIPNVDGTDLAELVSGTSASEEINAGAGSDWIAPDAGSDIINGGDGFDMVTFGALADTANRLSTQYRIDANLETGRVVTSGTDTYTLIDVERLTGTVHADRLKGDDGDNELRGLGDFDWFIATKGKDTIDGGTGRDMVSFVGAEAQSATQTADVFSSHGMPPVSGVSGIVLNLKDSSQNTGLAADLTLISVERITGSSQADVFFGDDMQNDFRGLGGYDWFVSSLGGRERYFGGDGLDTVTYANATAGVVASLRNGALVNGQESGFGSGGYASQDLYFDIENFVGSRFDDRLTGSDERNQINGLGGDDIIFGYGGVDYLMGGLGDDVLNGGDGSDYALFTGAQSDYTMTRTENQVVVTGLEGTDMLTDVEYFRFSDGDISIWDL